MAQRLAQFHHLYRVPKPEEDCDDELEEDDHHHDYIVAELNWFVTYVLLHGMLAIVGDHNFIHTVLAVLHPLEHVPASVDNVKDGPDLVVLVIIQLCVVTEV